MAEKIVARYTRMDALVLTVFVGALGWLLSDLPLIRSLTNDGCPEQGGYGGEAATETPSEHYEQAPPMEPAPSAMGGMRPMEAPAREAAPLFAPTEGLVRQAEPNAQAEFSSRTYLSNRQDGVAPFKQIQTVPLREDTVRVLPRILTTKSESQVRNPALPGIRNQEQPTGFASMRVGDRASAPAGPVAGPSIRASQPARAGAPDFEVARGDLTEPGHSSSALRSMPTGDRVFGALQPGSDVAVGTYLPQGNPVTSGWVGEGPMPADFRQSTQARTQAPAAAGVADAPQKQAWLSYDAAWQLGAARLDEARGATPLPNVQGDG